MASLLFILNQHQYTCAENIVLQ